MLVWYLAALGFGGTLIAVSLVLGGAMDKSFDKSFDKDFDKDLDKAFDHHEGIGVPWWPPLFSIRFWTFGLFAFGLAGTIATFLGVPSLLSAVIASGLGLVIGTLAARFFRALNRDQVTGATQFEPYVGEEAKVVLPIRPEQPGKIAISTLAGRVEMVARTRDLDAIPVGSTVLVASVGSDGVADVSRLSSTGEGNRTRPRAAQPELVHPVDRPPEG